MKPFHYFYKSNIDKQIIEKYIPYTKKEFEYNDKTYSFYYCHDCRFSNDGDENNLANRSINDSFNNLEWDIRKDILFKYIDGKSLFIDVGAAVGSYTLPMLALGYDVIAFEPKPLFNTLLKLNLSINYEYALEDNDNPYRKNVVLVDNVGLWEKDVEDAWYSTQYCSFIIDRNPMTGAMPEGLVDNPTLTNNNGLQFNNKVTVRSFDNIYRNMYFHMQELGYKNKVIIKIDTEGAELGVLRGMHQFIREYNPEFLIETHEFINPAITGLVTEHMKQYGYNVVENYQPEYIRGMGRYVYLKK